MSRLVVPRVGGPPQAARKRLIGQFVTIDSGGHLLLGQQHHVRNEVASFLSAAMADVQ